MTNLLPLVLMAISHPISSYAQIGASPQLSGDATILKAQLAKLPKNMEDLKGRPVSEWKEVVNQIFAQGQQINPDVFHNGQRSFKVKAFTIGDELSLSEDFWDKYTVGNTAFSVNAERIGSVMFSADTEKKGEGYVIHLLVDGERKAVSIISKSTDRITNKATPDYTGSMSYLDLRITCSDRQADSIAAVITWILRGYNSEVTFGGECKMSRFDVDKKPRWYKIEETETH